MLLSILSVLCGKEVGVSFVNVALSKEQFLHEVDSTGIQYGCKKGVCGRCVINVNEDAGILIPKCESEKMILEVIGQTEEQKRLACMCKASMSGNVSISIY
ncbi:hypothetical protein PE36_09698 [Moritella sp. PE36]|uniref:2Fe-2S iron-sulfur cluster-binding protein n=1 Tax=Moritella sp. PE36 TaxID=58051 RepID=UPI0001569DB2|nr:2Fe-2S iron-sulfur cluster-binding protein [Moritella sp. PE36]EDM65681.1 hypothetical protein PE36_09698 [Moritella sp. PE36]